MGEECLALPRRQGPRLTGLQVAEAQGADAAADEAHHRVAEGAQRPADLALATLGEDEGQLGRVVPDPVAPENITLMRDRTQECR